MVNLAFQALALLAFLLPGILFRSAYKKAFWNYPLGRLGPISDQIPRSLVHASWLNLTWCLAVHNLSFFLPRWIPRPDYQAAIYWFTNNFGPNQKHFDPAVRSLTAYPFSLCFYFFGLIVYAIAAGWLIHRFVRKLGLDKRFLLFRFDNDWFYQLSGEVLQFSDYQTTSLQENRLAFENRIGTLVGAVVEFKEKSYLYLGFHVDSFYDAAGNLDRILLEGAKRRELGKDAEGESDETSHFGSKSYYPIKGNYFVLRISEMKTFNLAYYSRDLQQSVEDNQKFQQLLDEVAKLEADAQEDARADETL